MDAFRECVRDVRLYDPPVRGNTYTRIPRLWIRVRARKYRNANENNGFVSAGVRVRGVRQSVVCFKSLRSNGSIAVRSRVKYAARERRVYDKFPIYFTLILF